MRGILIDPGCAPEIRKLPNTAQGLNAFLGGEVQIYRFGSVFAALVYTHQAHQANMVRIKHANYKNKTLQTRYAHLSSYCVKYGQRVKEGEIIGYSGVTGNVYGAHLHFEVILGGKRTNPLTWLDNDYTLATGREYQFNKGEHSVVVPEADKQTPSTDTTTNEAKTVQAILIGPLDAQTAAAFDDAAKTMQLGADR